MQGFKGFLGKLRDATMLGAAFLGKSSLYWFGKKKQRKPVHLQYAVWQRGIVVMCQPHKMMTRKTKCSDMGSVLIRGQSFMRWRQEAASRQTEIMDEAISSSSSAGRASSWRAVENLWFVGDLKGHRLFALPSAGMDWLTEFRILLSLLQCICSAAAEDRWMLSAYVIAHPAVSLVSTADRRSKITACASCFAGLHESPSFGAGETPGS